MKIHWLIPFGALLLLGAGCALSRSENNAPIVESPLAQETVSADQVPSAPIVQAQAASAITAEATPVVPRVISMKVGDFFFDPSSISAKPGEQLTIVFSGMSGHHVFTMDELQISEPIVDGGSIAITAPQTKGRYTYYCSVGPHRTLGMVGTLVVE
jgi:plastocyanin